MVRTARFQCVNRGSIPRGAAKMISFEEFKKLDIRIGKILSAEKIPSADKLLATLRRVQGEKRGRLLPGSPSITNPKV
jgi:hypothetical protein